MNKLIFVLLTIGLISCEVPNLSQYSDAPTQFIIHSIEVKDGMINMCAYTVEVVDVNGLVYDSNNGHNLMFTFCDSVGKYRLGQPIHFDTLK